MESFDAKAWLQQQQRLNNEGLYRIKHEKDSCGVGLIVATDGKANRSVIEAGIEALSRLWHRGAVDADGKTGDGAGIKAQIPTKMLIPHVNRMGHNLADDTKIAVGQIFLPRLNMSEQEQCRSIVERELIKDNLKVYGWRQVPINSDVIGQKAAATRPEIEQIIIAYPNGVDEDEFETKLYTIRRRIEKSINALNINDFYICSLSCREIIYKGMFLAEQLSVFYPDLQDKAFVSSYVIFHQRYSTNTFPTWKLAQPLRMLAHNGEINTIEGNINWTIAHEARMQTEKLNLQEVLPVIQANGSDSAVLDNMFELLCRTGRDAPVVKSMMIPESIGQNSSMDERYKNFFRYCNTVMEPWDGPAAICASDGHWVIAGLDRNGLRPLRYTLSKSGILAVGSETGMVDFDDDDILERGRISPGQMVAVNVTEGKFYHDNEIKEYCWSLNDYDKWVENIDYSFDSLKLQYTKPRELSDVEHNIINNCFDINLETIDKVLKPMVLTGQESIGSMGDDTPLAVLSERYRPLHHFFRQSFSQVTNPPIDSLRERSVMSTSTRLGNLGNVLEQSSKQTNIIHFKQPFVSSNKLENLKEKLKDKFATIDITFTDNLEDAIDRIKEEAVQKVKDGASQLLLSDLSISKEKMVIPPILAVGAINTYLVKNNLRSYVSIHVQSAECLDIHYAAVLVGVGATLVNPWFAEYNIQREHEKGSYGDISLSKAIDNYYKALGKGLLKVMSKMGISVVSSYRGGCNYEVVGLSRSLVHEHFPSLSSRISGIGFHGIEENIKAIHTKAWHDDILNEEVNIGGYYSVRKNSEIHADTAEQISLLHDAVRNNNWNSFKKYLKLFTNKKEVHLRDLLELKLADKALPASSVQSITEIRKQFVAPAMSIGALSSKAHETLAIAMNRIGAKSNSGEGGEDASRFKPYDNGDNACSSIKQVSTGRFGVTAEYLNNAQEIQIKMAQGAKPGEGGQLPGFKVSLEIAKYRHSTPGVTLISPPPHHDIYSIEDLAQLIYDLKQINSTAKICVKLVAREGIGTIAAGVAKAKADVILISGYDGGTGASPLSSIKYAGLPWEMGLSEVHQVLSMNNLRHRVKLRVDGGLRTGHDVIVAACLGAEEYGFGSASLMAMGCLLVRQCHSNTCPVGIATQDKKLVDKFQGSAEHVVNYMTFLAKDIQHWLAKLGIKSLQDLIGRTDLLRQVSRGSDHLDDLDLNPLLAMADTGGSPRYYSLSERSSVPDTLDAQMVIDAKPTLHVGEKMQLTYQVYNTHRAVGTRLSSHLVNKFGAKDINDDHLTVNLHGSAGQSLGAFATKGLSIHVHGDANDYVAKGLSGAIISIAPQADLNINSAKNTIVGNTVLYGATSGKLFAAGQAGARFGVRNSGATAVVEGCGSNGLEYMTGGLVAILGEVGDNFAAGMTGGVAFVYDDNNNLHKYINDADVTYQRIKNDYWQNKLLELINEHIQRTASEHAKYILKHFDSQKNNFWMIVPKEMLDKLEHSID